MPIMFSKLPMFTLSIILGNLFVECHQVNSEIRARGMSFEIRQIEQPDTIYNNSQITVPEYFERNQKFLAVKAEEAIFGFHKTLLEYVEDESFLTAKFQDQSDKLQKQLTGITTFVETVGPLNETLLGQLTFVRSMFQIMVSMAHLMDFYTAENGKAQELVHKMAHLNVQLVSLFDSYAEPDIRRPLFEIQVANFEIELWSLEIQFDSIADVAMSVRVSFEALRSRAITLFATLTKGLPFED